MISHTTGRNWPEPRSEHALARTMGPAHGRCLPLARQGGATRRTHRGFCSSRSAMTKFIVSLLTQSFPNTVAPRCISGFESCACGQGWRVARSIVSRSGRATISCNRPQGKLGQVCHAPARDPVHWQSMCCRVRVVCGGRCGMEGASQTMPSVADTRCSWEANQQRVVHFFAPSRSTDFSCGSKKQGSKPGRAVTTTKCECNSVPRRTCVRTCTACRHQNVGARQPHHKRHHVLQWARNFLCGCERP